MTFNVQTVASDVQSRQGCRHSIAQGNVLSKCLRMCRFAAFALIAFVIPAARGWAQEPTPFTSALDSSSPNLPRPITAGFWEAQADPLPGLPKPTDQPASLMAPAQPVYACTTPECPYFDCDPRLDPYCLPQPGCVADFEVGVVSTTLLNSPEAIVTTQNGTKAKVQVPNGTMDWTASPRLEFGYRLGEGFGEFVDAYRFLGAEGTGTTQGFDTQATFTNRILINTLDLDYASNELSICSWWMKWHLGVRIADVFRDSHTDEPLAAAQAGSGIVETTFRNNFFGAGLHGMLDLERRIYDGGFFALMRFEGATMLGRNIQTFTTVGTTPATSGILQQSNMVEVPVLDFAAGVGWRPPQNQCFRAFVGYQLEYWWNVDRIQDEVGTQVLDQSLLLRVDYNY